MSLQVLWCETCKRVVSKHHGGDLHRDHQAATSPVESLLASRDQRISQMEEAVDIVLEAAALLDLVAGGGAWLSAVAILRHARG